MQSPGTLDIIPDRPCHPEKRSLNEKGLLFSGGGFSTDWSQAAPQDIESNAKVECFPGSPVVKNPGDVSSIPGLGRSPRGGNGSPLQYSYLVNPMDGGAWWPCSP